MYQLHELMSIKEIKEKIWEIKTNQPGKTVCILGGTHGNELTGIEVVKKFVSEFENEKLKLETGRLIFALSNPKAIERNTRGAEDHQDLNRSFFLDVIERPGNETYEDKRAKELAPFLKQSDISIDIHSTNKPSEPMFCMKDDQEHKEIAKWFECPRILDDPKLVIGQGVNVTTDEYVDNNGGIGIAYESGAVSDLSKIGEVYKSILNIFRSEKMINDGVLVKDPQVKWESFQMEQAILLDKRGFSFAKDRGVSSFEPFSKGDLLGYYGQDELIAQFDGVIMFPKVKELFKIGKPVVYLAKQK